MLELIFEQIPTDGDKNFGYLIGDRRAKEAMIIDPSFRPEFLVRRAEAQGVKVKYIVNTHGHEDHTAGNTVAKRLTGAPIALHESSSVPHDIGLKEGKQLNLGDKLVANIFYSPGHSIDHILLYFPTLQALITGDHLFVGKIGGTATYEDSLKQYQSFQHLLKELPETTTLWPGHNYGARPSSTILLEKLSNPFLQAKNFEEFLEVKKNWKEIKGKMGLM